MTNQKKHSTRRMQDYEKEKLEIAHELGINGANETEVNAKMASENEAIYSSKTRIKKSNLNNEQKTAREKNYYRS